MSAPLLMRRPRYLALTLFCVVALGVSALTTIGRQEDPTITNIFATVVTPLPGADPARVEALVTEPIEARLREISTIKEIASDSATGVSSIRIELSDTLPDDAIETVWSEIRDALADVAPDLPAGAGVPVFDDDRTGAFTAIVAVAALPDAGASPAVLSRLAEALQEQLRSVPQTRLVRLFGAVEEEVRVEIDPDALAGLGLSPVDVAAALAGADAKVAAGRVRGAAADYVIEVSGEIDSLDRVRETPLVASGDRVVRVGDVARVFRATVEPPAEIAYADGADAVLVGARVENDKQVDRWAADVRAVVDGFAAQAPAGVSVRLIFDQSAYTAERLWSLAINLGVGVALVVAVLFVAMGWRSAVIVGLTLPLTSLLSLWALERLGVVIHQMSVTGMIVALGLLVDAAIVMSDEIRQALARGESRAAAAGDAVRRLAAPLAASTATTVLAFVPMAVLPGPAGDFVGAIALAVIVMLVVSLALSLTVTPALAGLFLPEPGGRGWWRDGMAGGALGRLFGRSLDWALRFPLAAMTVAATPAVVGFLALPTLTAQFFPGVERDQFHVQLDLGGGAAIGATDAAARAADALLRADPAVRHVEWVLGRSAPAFYYNMMANRDAAPAFAEALVTTTDADATPAAVSRLQAALDAALPQAQALVRELKQGPPVDAPVELRLVGPSVETLRALGEEARAVMATVPSVTHTRADLSGAAPKLSFDLDEDQTRMAGLSLADAAGQIAALAQGAQGGSLVEGPTSLPVRVRLPDAARAGAEDIAALTLNPPDGRARAATGAFPGTPLAALGTMRLVPSDNAIARRDGERVNTVQGYVAQGVLPDEALADLQARLAADPLPLPAGYRLEWGGESDARGETVRNLMATVGVVVVAAIASLVAAFNSWRLSAVASTVAGLSMGLSLLALAILDHPFGINALIGVIGSIGVSVNAAIIILSALQEDEAAAAGDRDAMRDVVMRSGRHIVSTTVTTVGGFLPLIAAGGAFWPPFAAAIAGGVLLSTVVAFYFTPPAFALVARRAPRAPLSVTQPALRLAAE